jgi:hypothetical protein
VSLIWIDDATDVQEPFDFTVAITTIDEAGNESEPVELDLSDNGSNACGCDGTASTWGAGALVAAALLVGRRRR